MGKFTLRVPDDMDKRLNEIADSMGISKNALIMVWIKEKLKKEEGK